MSLPRLILVRIEPAGVTVAVSPGANLLEAVRRAGVPIASTCSGQADCGECRISILEGQVTPLTPEEAVLIQPEDLERGVRLACRTRVLTQAKVRVEDEKM
jgi:Na+-transporting NADH:ubiquinone oxidoreductase subunit F